MRRIEFRVEIRQITRRQVHGTLKFGSRKGELSPWGKQNFKLELHSPLFHRTVGITTNGLTLGRKLPRLREAGLDAVNISLDTLVAPKFEFITRRKGHDRVVRAIDQCVEAGMRVKVSSNR